jgi:hypothetical protein
MASKTREQTAAIALGQAYSDLATQLALHNVKIDRERDTRWAKSVIEGHRREIEVKPWHKRAIGTKTTITLIC